MHRILFACALAACSSHSGAVMPDGRAPDGSAASDGSVATTWTAQSQSSLLELGASIGSLTPDPVQPRHFLLGLGGASSEVLVEWSDSGFGTPLQPPQAVGISPQQAGIAFAGSDGMFGYYGGFSTMNQQTPFKLATARAGGSWSWIDLAPQFAYPTWPPRNLATGTGSPPREVLYSDTAIWDVTGKLDPTGVLMWPYWSASSVTPAAEGGFATLRFLPGDSSTFLAAMVAAPTIHRCTFGSALTCDSNGATGMASGDTLGTLAIATSDPQRVYVMARTPAFDATLYTSSDGGRTFSTVPQPASMVSFQAWATSPVAPDTIVLYYPAYETDAGANVPDRLVLTRDRGATWTQLALPDGMTTTTDVDGIAFDAAGTLFLARGSVLFTTAL
jgi:hypothetical protein